MGALSRSTSSRRTADEFFIWAGKANRSVSVAFPKYFQEAPWGEWFGKALTARGLAKMLKPFDVASRTMRTDAGLRKGYLREAFQDAWGRYLPSQSVTSVTGPFEAKTGTDGPGDDNAVTGREKSESAESVPESMDVTDVTDKTPPYGDEGPGAPMEPRQETMRF